MASLGNFHLKFERWNNFNHSRPLVQKGYGGWLKIKNLHWCRSTFKVIGDHFGGLLDIASETLNLINVSEAQIQVKKNLCGFVPSTIEITDLKRGNIHLHFGDFEFLNPHNPLKAPNLRDNFNNSLDCFRIREVMIDEDLDPSFPLVQKIPKSVFTSLPRSRNPFEILKIFPTLHRRQR